MAVVFARGLLAGAVATGVSVQAYLLFNKKRSGLHAAEPEAAKYELYYFNVRARGETDRLTLAAAGANWRDVRLTGDQWKELKPEVPTGQVPALKIDDREWLCQSGAIARYVARAHGLAGYGNLDEGRVDMIMGCVEDLRSAWVRIRFEKEEQRKAEMRKAFSESGLPKGLAMLETFASYGGFFVGNKLSVADVDLFSLSEMVSDTKVDWSLYPNLSRLLDNVRANPGVAAYLDTRPDTSF